MLEPASRGESSPAARSSCDLSHRAGSVGRCRLRGRSHVSLSQMAWTMFVWRNASRSQRVGHHHGTTNASAFSPAAATAPASTPSSAASSKTCWQLGYDCIGFLKGYEGLYDPVSTSRSRRKNTTGILNQGGTILGSTNKGRFAATVGVHDRVELDPELLDGVEDDGRAARPRGPDLHRRRRLAGRRPAVSRIRHPGRRRAQDDRQRPVGHGVHVRLRQRRRLRDRRARPPAHHGRQPRADDGAGSDGPARRLDRAARRHRRRRRRDPDSRDSLDLRKRLPQDSRPRARTARSSR